MVTIAPRAYKDLWHSWEWLPMKRHRGDRWAYTIYEDRRSTFMGQYSVSMKNHLYDLRGGTEDVVTTFEGKGHKTWCKDIQRGGHLR